MKHLLRFYCVMMGITFNIVGSSDSSPEIIIKTIQNGTPFTLKLHDRQVQPCKSTIMSPNSITEYDYALGDSKDIAVEDLSSTDMYVKADYFCHQARFKIAALGADGRRKEGKSNYAHIGVASDMADATQAVITFRYGQLYTETLQSRNLLLSRCKRCNSGRVVEIGCIDCKKVLENLITSKQVAVDIMLCMNEQEVENDTGRLTCGYRIRQKRTDFYKKS